MYDEKLILGEYGTLVTTYEAYIDKKQLLFMNYKDIEKKIKIEAEFVNKSRGYSVYCKEGKKEKNTKLKSNTEIGSYDLNTFMELLYNNKLKPTMYTYNNSENRTKSSFEINHSIGKYDFSFAFDSNKIVLFTTEHMEVYNVDDVAFSSGSAYTIEYYDFIDEGYVNHNFEDKEFPEIVVFNKGKLFDFSLGNNIDELFLEKIFIMFNVPLYVDITDESGIRSGYQILANQNGMIYSVTNNADPKNNLCRYECCGPKLIEKNIDSDLPAEETVCIVYPCLYNLFDPNYVDTPLLYWAEDKIDYRNDIISIRRNMYRIDQSKLNSLIEIVQLKTYYPIIEVYEN